MLLWVTSPRVFCLKCRWRPYFTCRNCGETHLLCGENYLLFGRIKFQIHHWTRKLCLQEKRSYAVCTAPPSKNLLRCTLRVKYRTQTLHVLSHLPHIWWPGAFQVEKSQLSQDENAETTMLRLVIVTVMASDTMDDNLLSECQVNSLWRQWSAFL